MSTYTCPCCQNPFGVPALTSAAHVLCPHCRQAVELPKPASAATALAATPPAPKRARSSASMPKKNVRRWLPWLIAALTGAAACAVLGLVLVGYFVFLSAKSSAPEHANTDRIVEEKKKAPAKNNVDLPKKDGDLPKKGITNADKKKTPQEKDPPAQPHAEWADQFVERLNRQRKRAGLDSVILDAEQSRGCQAHAKYLAQDVDPLKVDGAQLFEEDPKKPGFSIEGQRAGQNALVAFAEPLVALEKWMGRLFSRAALLTPEMQSVGIGYASTGPGSWICVLDPGERTVVFPGPKQTDVPLSFTDGPEVPDPKAAAGFPITVTLPPARKVTDARIELRDEKNKLVEGWTWTPEKPVRSGRQHNTITLIPKGLLHGGAAYQVEASAQVDGQKWNLAWSFTTEDAGDSKGIWAKKALAKVNAYRADAGLKPVELDGKLSRGCLAHARYLVINEGHPALQGLNAHDENLDLPGASEEGRSAGKASNIAVGDFEPLDGVDAWMATLYHRVPILEPNLERVGFACARGRRQGWVTVLNVLSGRARGSSSQPGLYPVPDQTGVPLSFPNGGEEPNPIPQSKTGRAGYPITVFFPPGEPLQDATGKLTNSQGIEAPCWFSSPQKPANPNYAKNQGNTVCLIPKEPLAANATYHVEIQGQLEGKAWYKKWKFTTGEAGPSVADATRMVVDRLNQYRALAGLSAIALDMKLSYGCQLHAEYLVKNAEALLKKNASVNDEDVNLPGFTREGLRSAQQSMVFTNAPTPVFQVDDLMATFSSRIHLLDPRLQRIGFGCFHDVGRGWRCVLDVNGGRGNSRVVVYPAFKQHDVPMTGFDLLKAAKGNPGFPISVMFPRQAILRNAKAVLLDADGKNVDVQISTPEQPLNEKPQPGIIGVHPLQPLQAGQVYSATVSVIVNSTEWRQTWQFTTRKNPR